MQIKIPLSSPKRVEKLNTETILSNVQANIFRPHGREFSWCLFLKFLESKKTIDLRERIHEFAFHDKLKLISGSNQRRRNTHDGIGNIVTTLSFSSKGLEVIGIKEENFLFPKENSSESLSDILAGKGNPDSPFAGGMLEPSKLSGLGDTFENLEEGTWKKHSTEIHALIIIADNNPIYLQDRLEEIETFFDGFANILFVEKGEMLFKRNRVNKKEYYEPFGFRDGLSHLPLLSENKSKIRVKNRHLILDRMMGSYLVFRKLEQDVDSFNQKVIDLTIAIFYPEKVLLRNFLNSHEFYEKKQWVEAQIVGRFKDGTPLTISTRPLLQYKHANQDQLKRIEKFNKYRSEDKNRITYGRDRGNLCPLHAHIRKTNPRDFHVTDTSPGYAGYVTLNKRLARRGVPYVELTKGKDSDAKIKQGILFMSYQASIEFQFEIIQKDWINTPNFPNRMEERTAGIDPLIGKSKKRKPETNYVWNTSRNSYPYSWDIQDLNFQNLVTCRGGEYLYTPSLPWFQMLI